MRNTRDDVIDAALRVLDEHGLEFCSMRRVAAALDVQPSALYHHVPNKQSLLALMADEIVSDVVLQHRRSGGEDPATLCRLLRRALLGIRDGADVVATASAFRLGASSVEARLAELVGIDGARTLLLYTFGQAQATQTQLQAHAIGVLPEAADLRPRHGGLDRGLIRHPAGAERVAGSNDDGRPRHPAGAERVAGSNESFSDVAPSDLETEPDLETDLDRSFDRGIAIILSGLGR